MHSLHSPWTSQAEGCSARKSLLLASRLKFQQVCQPSDPPVCAGKSKFLSSCQHMQMKTSDANTQHWLRQAQPLHQQSERSGTIQRLCAQPQISRYGPVSDDEWGESLPPPRDSKRVNAPDRKSMQAIAMPKKKQGPGDKLQTVQLQGGGKAQVPAPQEPTHTGIGDYARRVKQAGVFDAAIAEPHTAQRHRNCCSEEVLILTLTAQRGRTLVVMKHDAACQPACSLGESISNNAS